MSDVGLVARQVRFENRGFWRNPAAAFFTFAFPLMFLVIFNTVLPGGEVPYGGKMISTQTYYVPAIAAFSIITACYTNIAMSMVFLRDEGVLKRKRGTPLPAWAYLSGRIIHSVLLAILLVSIIAASGALFYDAEISAQTLPAFLVSLAIGAAAFCALGLAVTAVVPNAEAAPAVIQAIILPLLFISGVFIPLTNVPDWLDTFSNLFPIRHYVEAMLASFIESDVGFPTEDLIWVAAWGVAGLLLAVKYFRWEPKRS
ncbi:MAG: ABC transporter permease [Actinobacteria bacterium]|nr:ABC transporter permease [Actinomycetota bacterium]